MFDGVVQQVDQHLHHEPCVHAGHEQAFGHFRAQIVVRCTAAGDLHGFGNNIFKQFRFKAKGKILLLKTGEGQQVFHHAHKVAGFFLNGGSKGRIAFRRAGAALPGKDGGIAADAGERRAQIVRDGAQYIGAQFFLLCTYGNAGVGLREPFLLQSQRAFPCQGQNKVFAVGIGKRSRASTAD